MAKIKSKKYFNSDLKGKEIILGICGGIAAYKAPFLIRELKNSGANVTCVLTENGEKFVTVLTLQVLSGNKVFNDMFDTEIWDVEHIALAKKADIVAVVPATADFISRAAFGRAEDLLSSVVLATKAPVIICPAMNENMWQHKATRFNIQRIRSFGYKIVEPVKGMLACGDEGAGRLADIETIISSLKANMS